ncbi:MAG: hypothetical protein ACE15C_21260 [Phycisphaerae bacterium]
MHNYSVTDAKWEKVSLLTCGGGELADPSTADMRKALAEVFSGCHAGEARLKCDAADDTVCVITVSADGRAVAIRYADDSMSRQLAQDLWHDLNQRTALQLWKKIIAGHSRPPPSTPA